METKPGTTTPVFQTRYEAYMRRALQLAALGGRAVMPNPLVGAVLVGTDGQIISEGWHRQYGGPHAEVDAVNHAPQDTPWKDCTLYVTLEPCNHFGKTPPCTGLILEKEIGRVVYGCTDPNPLVAGKGLARLREAGIEVIGPVLEKECRDLNHRFFTQQVLGRPYIILKWAQTQEGVMGYQRDRLLITGPEANQLSHQWRTREAAILVGAGTAIADNPTLTARHWPGDNPVRVVLDSSTGLPQHLYLWDGAVRTLVVSSEPRQYPNAETRLVAEGTPQAIAEALLKAGLQSVIIEGGAAVLNRFIAADLYDEVRVWVGNPSIDPGKPAVRAPQLSLAGAEVTQVGSDRLYTLRRPRYLR